MPSDLPMICRERAHLLRTYAGAAHAYASSVGDMAEFVMSGQEVRANEARRLCRAAWDDAEKSRLALYRHEADHNCARAADLRNIPET
jgi:hypothetical protein